MLRLIPFSVLALVCSPALAQEAPRRARRAPVPVESPREAPREAQPRRSRAEGKVLDALRQRFDLNQDGRIDESERSAGREVLKGKVQRRRGQAGTQQGPKPRPTQGSPSAEARREGARKEGPRKEGPRKDGCECKGQRKSGARGERGQERNEGVRRGARRPEQRGARRRGAPSPRPVDPSGTGEIF